MVRALDNTVDHRALEVKDALNLSGTAHAILHHDELHRLLILHLDRIDSIDSCQQTVIMFDNVCEVSLLNSLESVEIVVSHSLDDEALISTEEEKAA